MFVLNPCAVNVSLGIKVALIQFSFTTFGNELSSIKMSH